MATQLFVPAPPEPGDVRTKFPYVPALDGIRGLLVFPVLLFHFSIIGAAVGERPTVLAPGSYFAPSMFFTLSGFLITSLLLIEKQRKETTGEGVDWAAFWKRRFRRLIPGSMFVVLMAVLIPVVWSGAWTALRPAEALAAVFSVKNWQDIGYASSADPSVAARTLGPLSPYWSLSIEEQFYLGMSIVIGLCMLTRRWRTWLGWSFGLLAAGSVVAGLVISADPPNRELFGTDVRAFELIAGCLLAMAVQRWGWPRSRWWAVLGFAGLAYTVFLWGWVDEFQPWVLDGGLALVALVNVGMIVGASAWGSPFARLMELRPLVEIGKLSYPLYLVHWPVARATQAEHVGFGGWGLMALRFALSLAIAVPMTRFVETPIRSSRVLSDRGFAAAWAVVVAVILAVTWLNAPA